MSLLLSCPQLCALKVGRSTASHGYSAKNEALLSEMGLGEFCQNVETFDVDLLKAQVTKLLSNRQIYKNHLKRANVMLEERLQHQDQILASDLLVAQASGL